MVTQSRINKLLELTGHYDKDERYMAANDLCNELIEHVMKSFEKYCYFKWLLSRWVHIRDNKDHLPKKRLSLDKCVIRKRKK